MRLGLRLRWRRREVTVAVEQARRELVAERQVAAAVSRAAAAQPAAAKSWIRASGGLADIASRKNRWGQSAAHAEGIGISVDLRQSDEIHSGLGRRSAAGLVRTTA